MNILHLDEIIEYRKKTEKSAAREIKSESRRNSRQKLQLKYLDKFEKTDFKNISDRLNNLKELEFKNMLKTEFDNRDVMKDIATIANIAVYLPPKSHRDRLFTFNIKNQFLNLHRTGFESQNSFALISDFGGASEVFILKTPRDSDKKSDAIHEWFLGTHVVNNLRDFVPNFIYTYGIFFCSGTVINENKNVVSWCEKPDNSSAYIMIEKIDGISYREFLRKCNNHDDILNIYLQVLYALQTANSEYEFTHYDLHDGNILLRSEKRNINYLTERGSEILEANYIATIFDFDTSRAFIYDRSFSSEDKYNGNTGNFFPMSDAYRLLGYTLNTLRESNPIAFRKTKWLFSYFTDEKVTKKLIFKYLDTQFVLEPTKRNMNLDIFTFTSWIRGRYEAKFITPGRIPSDMVSPDVYEKLGLNLPIKLVTIYDFYRVQNKKYHAKNFDINNALKLFDAGFAEIIASTTKSFRSGVKTYVSLVDEYTNKILSVKFFESYRKSVSRIVAGYSQILYIDEMLDMLEEVIKYFKNHSDILERYDTRAVEVMKNTPVDAARKILEDIEYTKYLETDNEKFFERYPKLYWYTKSLPNFKTVFDMF